MNVLLPTAIALAEAVVILILHHRLHLSERLSKALVAFIFDRIGVPDQEEMDPYIRNAVIGKYDRR